MIALWEGVTPSRVLEIMNAHPSKGNYPIKDRLLHSILDGPLDADKLDYLRRDSLRLGVTYGQGIDTERILRNLTTVIHKQGPKAVACIGVHEKAKVAAEFVAEARYAMFSQVYWQHTVRAMKAMLSRAVDRLLAQMDGREASFRQEFEQFVIALPGGRVRQQAFTLDAEGETAATMALPEETAFLVGTENSIAPTDAAVMRFLSTYLTAQACPEEELLRDLLERRLYKRLFVFSRERTPDEWKDFADDWGGLKAPQKLEVYAAVEKAIIERCRDRATLPPHTVVLDHAVVGSLEFRGRAGLPLILLDVPAPRPGSDVPLHYVVESQRRSLRKDERAVGEAHESGIWKNFTGGMREGVGKVRIFCHPDFIDAVEAVVTKEDFQSIFADAVEDVRG